MSEQRERREGSSLARGVETDLANGPGVFWAPSVISGGVTSPEAGRLREIRARQVLMPAVPRHTPLSSSKPALSHA